MTKIWLETTEVSLPLCARTQSIIVALSQISQKKGGKKKCILVDKELKRCEYNAERKRKRVTLRNHWIQSSKKTSLQESFSHCIAARDNRTGQPFTWVELVGACVPPHQILQIPHREPAIRIHARLSFPWLLLIQWCIAPDNYWNVKTN